MLSVPPMFIRVMVVAVAVPTILVRSVSWVVWANVNAETIVCFGLVGAKAISPFRGQTHKKISFHMTSFLVWT
jgi:hypothetical protein